MCCMLSTSCVIMNCVQHQWAILSLFPIVLEALLKENITRKLLSLYLDLFFKILLFQDTFLIFLAATKQLYKWYFPSVRLSVCLSHLFDYVPIIVSSWNFQELSHWTKVRTMQKVKVRGQRSRSQRSRPNFPFPDCNSSLNSHMMMKWFI